MSVWHITLSFIYSALLNFVVSKIFQVAKKHVFLKTSRFQWVQMSQVCCQEIKNKQQQIPGGMLTSVNPRSSFLQKNAWN